MSQYFAVDREKLPTFICIGGQRCGSTWLDTVLRSHPQILLSPKESSFFNLKIRTEKLEWYYQFFDTSHHSSHAPEKFAKGDVTPAYSAMFFDEVAFVKKLVPDLKIIFFIRNPIDRMISQITRQWTYAYVDKGASTTRNLFSLLRQIDVSLSRRLTDYYMTYRIWSHFFGEDQILLKKYDDLADNPKETIREILQFIDIDELNQIPEGLFYKKPNSSKFKNEVPDILKWYLALEWLPKVRLLQEKVQHCDFNDWINSMEKIASESHLSWKLIRIIHKLYFAIPYKILFSIFNVFRIKFRVIKTQAMVLDFISQATQLD
jgi:LPS sulfotransferase NodH